MPRSFLVLAIAWALATPAVAARAPDIYVLMGQSNMSGRGLLKELTPEEQVADPTIQLYGNDGRMRPALDPLDDAIGQMDLVSADPQAAVGPGLFLARWLRSREGRPIVLIPCAKGGSAIAQWAGRGGRETLYGSCIARIGEVVAGPSHGRVKGVLWYQGETDAEQASSARAWRAAFLDLVGRLRTNLGQPRLPIVMVQLGDPPDPAVSAPKSYPSWQDIQAVQAGAMPDCVAMVPASGLPLKSDTLHLATAGQRVLGGRLAEAFRDLQNRKCR